MIFFRGLVTLALAFQLSFFSPAAATNLPPTITSQKIIEILSQVDFKNEEAAIRSIDSALGLIEHKPYGEVFEALTKATGAVFETLLTKMAAGMEYSSDFRAQLTALNYSLGMISNHAPISFKGHLEILLNQLVTLARRGGLTQVELETIEGLRKSYLDRIQQNNFKEISLVDLEKETQPPEKKDIKIELAEYEARLNAEIKGQPEVVSALVDIRRRDLIYGYRREPAVLWLLGLPGTGKDTSAMAYANAVLNSPKAHEKHVFKVYPMLSKADLWTYLGSSTGYVGSDGFPPLLDFLVLHSGGKYIKAEAGKDQQGKILHKIVLNEEWREGDLFPGYYPAESAVVYLDEFHAWSKQIKDLFVKKALEPNGGFVINNPNGGLDKIQVPVTFIIGSNDGIELIASREKNGQRFGKPMSYEEMIERYSKVASNTVAIKNAIMAGNGNINESASSEGARGTSEELLNRVQQFRLMRPLAPEQLQAIAENKIRERIDKLAQSRSGFEKLKLEYTSKLIQFLQSYQYVAEDSARALDQKISQLVEAPLFKALADGKIPARSEVKVVLDVVQNKDRTYSLSVKMGRKKALLLPIEATTDEKAKAPISDARLDELDQLESRLNTHVVGQELVTKQIARAVKLSEEGRQGITKVEDAKEAARAYMLLGLSSTGKSQLGKAVGQELLGSADSTFTIQFTPDMSGHDIRAKLIGLKDASGNPIASDFMKHFDRNGGRIVVMLDEIANVRDKEILNMLYDLIREPVVTTFSDGVPRAMSNVTFLITGNAGQELYTELPAHLPEVVRRAALSEIYQKSSGNPNLRREVLSKYFSEAFINRVGEDRIFDFAPLGYLAASQLVQLKLQSSLEDLKAKDGRRGWEIYFKSEKSYRGLIDAFEREGFIAREQGASIDHFVGKKFKDGLRELLLSKRVPSNSKVILDFVSTTSSSGAGTEAEGGKNIVLINVEAEDGQKFELRLDGKQQTAEMQTLNFDMILTAFHEAGHELVRATLLRDFFQPQGIKIIPGVAHIGGKWIHYAGLASSLKRVQTQLTREYLVREIAVLFGGFIAEDLVIEGGYSSHGKQNDIERATKLAEMGILQLGLSEAWGVRNADKALLSEEEKALLAKEVDKLFSEGKKLAREAIVANAKTFEAMGNELAKKGVLSGSEIEALYKSVGIKEESAQGFDRAVAANEPKFAGSAQPRRGLKYSFKKSLKVVPENQVVDIVARLEKERQTEISKLAISDKIRFLAGFVPAKSKANAKPAAAAAASPASCDDLLKRPKK